MAHFLRLKLRYRNKERMKNKTEEKVYKVKRNLVMCRDT